jgi:DNA-binding NarL/FixJ family response regulator
MSRSILIVDDHPIMRRGYTSLLGRVADLEVCGEAGSAQEALALIEEHNPDLAIVDISLGGMNGIELTKHIRAEHPGTLVLVVSMHDESLYAERALAAGARGYIMKSEVDNAVVDAVRHVLDGGYYVSEAMSSKLFAQFGSGHRARGVDDPVERLSDRELEVFEMIGLGKSTVEIADALVISPKTVESHRAKIREKLGLGSGREVMRHAVQWLNGTTV